MCLNISLYQLNTPVLPLCISKSLMVVSRPDAMRRKSKGMDDSVWSPEYVCW